MPADRVIDLNEPTGPDAETLARDLKAEIEALWEGVTVELESVAGTGTAFTATLDPMPLTLVNGMAFWFRPHIDSVASATLTIGALGSYPIRHQDGSRIRTGGLRENVRYKISYFDSAFYLLAVPSNPGFLAFDAFGDLADRSSFDGEADGFVYLSTDQDPWEFSIRRGGSWLESPNPVERAEQWAEAAQDVEVETGRYSSKHWALAAAESAAEAAASAASLTYATKTEAEAATAANRIMSPLQVAQQGRALLIGPSSADLAAAWVAGQRRLRGTKGFEYEFTVQMASSILEDVYLDFAGCGWKQMDASGLLSLSPPFEQEQVVSASTSTTTTVSNGAVFSPGDVIKKRSVGVRMPEHFAVATCKGESLTVISVSGNVLTHAPSIYDYTTGSDTNVRVARHATPNIDIHIGWLNTVSTDPVSAATLITITGARSPAVKIDRVYRSWGHALAFRGCYAPQAEIKAIRRIAKESEGYTSYGIVSTSTQGGSYKVGSAEDVRHAVDFGTGSGTDFSDSGPAEGYVAEIGSSDGSQVTPCSSHHGSRNGTYKIGRSRGSISAVLGSRGTDHVYDGFQSENDAYLASFGLQSGYTPGEADSTGYVLRNGRARNVTNQFLTTDAAGVGTVEIDGCTFEMNNGLSHTITLYVFGGTRLHIHGGHRLKSNQIASATGGILHMLDGSGELIVDGWEIDLRGGDWDASVYSVIRSMESAGNLMHLHNIRVRADATSTGAIDHFLRGWLSSGSTLGNIEIDWLDEDFWHTEGANEFWKIDNANMITGPIRVLGGTGKIFIEPRRKDWTQYLLGNAGPQVWTGVTTIAATTVFQELADGWWVARVGGTDATIARNSSVPAGLGAPWSVKATSVTGNTAFRFARRMTAAQAKALMPHGLLSAWVNAPSGETITLSFRKCDALDDFSATTELTNFAKTAGSGYDEIAIGQAFAAADVENGIECRLAVTVSAAAQDVYVIGLAPSKGYVPPLFDLAPYDHDALVS